MPPSFTRTLRLKVRPESDAWLNAAAMEVNTVFNWANATSIDAADRNRRAQGKFLSAFDLNNLSAGASEHFEHIGADTIQRVNGEYAARRRAAKRVKLRWRVSRGPRRSRGWVPFKAASLKRKGKALRFCGKTFRVFNHAYLGDHTFRDGCFAQDSLGDWYVCIPVQIPSQPSVAPEEVVGIDLGLKAIATTSEGEILEAGRWTQQMAAKLALAQRRGHRRQAKRWHRKAANRRRDALHKFSKKVVDRYQKIVVGDVSSSKLVKTRMATAVLDSGWGMLRNFLDYKSQRAARTFLIVNEQYTSVTCSACGALSGPRGVNGLSVRSWTCAGCGERHDRDVNSARVIRLRGEVSPSVCGNEPASHALASSRASRPRETRKRALERTA